MHYPIALRILEDEYGNQTRLVERLNDRLLSLKPITKSGELKPLVRTFEKCCKLLEAKHVDVQNNSLLRQDFVKKLPKRVIAKVYEAEAKSATWDTNDLRKMLANVVQLETRVDETYSQSHSEKKPQGKKPQQAYSTVEVGKQTPANSKEKPTKGNCKFCSKDHKTYYCEKYKSADERIKRCQELKLCLNCLAPGHFVKDCRSKYRCTHCKGKHSSSLCKKANVPAPRDRKNSIDDSKSGSGRGKSVKAAVAPRASSPSSESKDAPTGIIGTVGGGSHSGQVLFMSARVLVCNPFRPS